jgi:hypothetical protein
MSQNIFFATPSVSGFSKQKYIYKNAQENLIFPQRQKSSIGGQPSTSH